MNKEFFVFIFSDGSYLQVINYINTHLDQQRVI